jgi:hypothetical protein
MRAARIVSLVLLTLWLTIPAVAQLPGTVVPRTGLTEGAYTLQFDLRTRPPVPEMQWTKDLDFRTQAATTPPEFAVPLGVRARVLRESPDDSVCYTARSYLYARPSRHSDVTIPVGYRVCTPSAKFQVKSADLPRR